MTNEIEFHPQFILPLLEGRKTQTTRIHDRFGGVGDFLTVDGGANYGLRLQITAKQTLPWIPVAMYRHDKEGFICADDFEKFWDSLYGATDYASENNPDVIVIEFKIISKWHDREWLNKMYSEKGLF